MPAASAMKWMVATTFAWVSMTPRGRPVLPDVTVSSYSRKYCWPGDSAARRRIISVRVGAPFTSSSTIHTSSGAADRALVTARTERRGRRVRFAVAQVEHRDAVAWLAIADERSELLEPVDGRSSEPHDHVALAQPRPLGAGPRHDTRQPEAVVARTGQGDDAEERPAGHATALALPPRRARDLRVHGARVAREPIDDPRADGCHASHAGRVELVGGVARFVIVAVPARIEEQDRDTGRIEPAVVGGAVRRAVDLQRDAFGLRCVAHEGPEPAAAVAAADAEHAPLQPADHVEVHHRDGALEREGRPAHVVARTDQPELLGAEEREDQRAVRPAGRGEGPREPEDHGRAGCIVVGARVHDAVGAPEVIVVRADDHGFGGERRVGAG